jgi:hypothetical protein
VAGEWKPDLVDVGEQIREVSFKINNQIKSEKREREKKKTFGLFQMVFQNLSAAQKLLHSWFNGQRKTYK